MKLLSALLVLLAGCGGCVSVPPMESMRASALALKFERGGCSGTAQPGNIVLTAKHCMDLGGKLVQVDGVPVKVDAIGRDKDTMTLHVTGITLTHVARLGPLPKQGDRVRWWGNPEGNGDIYREGYVSRADKNLIVISAPICHGDSGAGIFNDRGEVVAVVSAMTNEYGCTFELSYPLPTA